VLQGGTISMPTGRHVDNDFIRGVGQLQLIKVTALYSI